MEKNVRKIIAGDKAILEATDLCIDIDKYINECKQKGIKKENIRITLVDCPGVYIDINTLGKLKKQLEILTSSVEPNDTEVQKFAKITASIRKNIKYAHTKTKSRNIGATGNFIEGLLKGKCVCIGYAIITKMALRMHDIDAEIVISERRRNRTCLE